MSPVWTRQTDTSVPVTMSKNRNPQQNICFYSQHLCQTWHTAGFVFLLETMKLKPERENCTSLWRTPSVSVSASRRLTLKVSRSLCKRSWRVNSPRTSVNTSSCRLATRDPVPVLHPLTDAEFLVSVEGTISSSVWNSSMLLFCSNQSFEAHMSQYSDLFQKDASQCQCQMI